MPLFYVNFIISKHNLFSTKSTAIVPLSNHFFDQVYSLSGWFRRMFMSSSPFICLYNFGSSTNYADGETGTSGMSFLYMTNTIGPRTIPCRMPHDMI